MTPGNTYVINGSAPPSQAVSAPRPAAQAPSLSPTQLTSWLNCSYAWYCKTQLRISDPPTAKLAIGRAVHRTVATALRGKGAGVIVEIEELVTDFATPFAEEELRAVPDLQGPTAEHITRSNAMVREWHRHLLPRIEPIAVERDVAGLIGGIMVRGIVDAIDKRDAAVIETKSSSRKPSELKPAHRLQAVTYAHLAGLQTARVDTLSQSTRSTSHTSHTIQVTPEQVKHVEALYPAVHAAMASGLVTPNRTSDFCKRSSCRFWKQCQKEWGGVVPE